MTSRGLLPKTISGQQGVSLITAIFLLVVLAGLAAAMVNVSIMQNTSSAMDVQGARAYQAARAGIEWGVYQRLINSAPCAGTTSFVPPAFMPPSPPAPLSTFTVTVTCAATSYAGATPNLTVYRITSTACNQPSAGNCPGVAGSAGYIERQIQVNL